MNSPFSLQFELGRAQAQLASYRVLVADESRSRREQYLAATLPGFRDRFRDLFEAVGRDNGGRDRVLAQRYFSGITESNEGTPASALFFGGGCWMALWT